MGFSIYKTVYNGWQPATAILILMLVFTAGIAQISTAQNQTLPPRAINIINRDLPRFQIAQQDTSNLELLNSFNFQNLQLQPRQKTIVNLNRDISRVDIGTMNRIDPAIFAGVDKQNIFSFPELHVENSGASGSEADQIIYQPVITSLKPMVFDRMSNTFTSTLSFLLLSADQSSGDISTPMPIELHSDFLDNFQPSNQLRIGHLNLPSTNVSISARNVRDSVQIRIVTEAKTDGYVTYLKVEPTLNLFTERKRLQGLGIQQVPLQLTWRGSSSDESKVVNISSSKGTVTPNSVELSYNQPAIVYLRSEGIGNASLTASTTGAQSNTLQINFIFPWVFLIFSLAGGFLGGTAKYFTLSEKPKSFLTTTIGSLTIGLLGALAYFVLGINLLNIEFSSTFNEFAVFGISALIAFFGIRKL